MCGVHSVEVMDQVRFAACSLHRAISGMVELCVNEWRENSGKLQGRKEIVSLTGETSVDLRLLEKEDAIVCTPTQWDVIS